MKLYISSCAAVKSGESNGRKWTLYQIQDPKGVKYSTFEGKYVGMVGQEIEAVVEEKAVEKNGKSYLNRTIVEPKRSVVQFDASRIETKLDRILELLQNLVPADEDAPDGPEPENEDPGF